MGHAKVSFIPGLSEVITAIDETVASPNFDSVTTFEVARLVVIFSAE